MNFPTWIVSHFLLLLSVASSFPLNQRLIQEAEPDSRASIGIGRHPIQRLLDDGKLIFDAEKHPIQIHSHRLRKHWHRHHRKRINWMREALVRIFSIFASNSLWPREKLTPWKGCKNLTLSRAVSPFGQFKFVHISLRRSLESFNGSFEIPSPVGHKTINFRPWRFSHKTLFYPRCCFYAEKDHRFLPFQRIGMI